MANGASMGAKASTPSVSRARAETTANSTRPLRTSSIVRASELTSSLRQCVRDVTRVGTRAMRPTVAT
jgi:hypothetical protein